jgi:antitoxin HicB
MEKLMYPFMTRVLLPEEGGGYLIEFPDLPGCMSDGETLEEAIENGKDALQCWIEAAAEDGQEIPEPGSSPTWVQQVPTDVHIQLSKRATAEGMSLSELVASILDQATDDRVKGLRHERHKASR